LPLKKITPSQISNLSALRDKLNTINFSLLGRNESKINGNFWKIGAMPGPHGNPDYFKDQDIAKIWKHTFRVSHNANRLGVRLEIQEKLFFEPEWSRPNGGDAGIHPSNIHDYPYGKLN
jgi:hypothetical protein